MTTLFILAKNEGQGRAVVRGALNINPRDPRIVYLYDDRPLMGRDGIILIKVGEWHANKNCTDILQTAELRRALILEVQP